MNCKISTNNKDLGGFMKVFSLEDEFAVLMFSVLSLIDVLTDDD